jgi:hypothetical protein
LLLTFLKCNLIQVENVNDVNEADIKMKTVALGTNIPSEVCIFLKRYVDEGFEIF